MHMSYGAYLLASAALLSAVALSRLVPAKLRREQAAPAPQAPAQTPSR